MNIKVVIPAHLDSVRLKRKVLLDIKGLPMIEHVRRRVLLAKSVDKVYVATGNYSIKKIVENYGGEVIFTKKRHLNGTSRVSEAVSKIDCSHLVLVQGDEPLLIPNYIDKFIIEMKKTRKEKMWNAVSRFDKKFINEPSVVKCFLDANENIIICFRKSPISYEKSNSSRIFYKIQGLIAYEKYFLKEIVSMKQTIFEKLESIEQMRAIEYGKKIKAIHLPRALPSVNNISELKVVKKILTYDLTQQKIFNKINYK